jgi:hypothetical protein
MASLHTGELAQAMEGPPPDRLMVYGKGGPYGTRSKRRVIPLTARVQPLLEGHFALHDEFGMSVRTVQRIVRIIANRAQISRKVSPHVLRHTFTVTAVQKGISLPALQAASGARSSGDHGDLFEPQPRARDQGVHGEVVKVTEGSSVWLVRGEQIPKPSVQGLSIPQLQPIRNEWLDAWVFRDARGESASRCDNSLRDVVVA